MDDRPDDVTLRRFLLGQSAESERVSVENQFLADQSVFEALEAVEDELIDAYLVHELSSRDRSNFEAYYLSSPARRARVEQMRQTIAAANHVQVDAIAPTRRWNARALTAIAAMVMLGVLVALMLALRRGPATGSGSSIAVNNAPEQSRKPGPAPQNIEPGPVVNPQAVSDSSAPHSARTETAKTDKHDSLDQPAASSLARHAIATVVLSAGVVRDLHGTARFEIEPDVGTVTVRLNLDVVESNLYAVTVSTVEGKIVWRQSGLRPADKVVAFSVPAQRLGTGDYIVDLRSAGHDSKVVASYALYTVLK